MKRSKRKTVIAKEPSATILPSSVRTYSRKTISKIGSSSSSVTLNQSNSNLVNILSKKNRKHALMPSIEYDGNSSIPKKKRSSSNKTKNKSSLSTTFDEVPFIALQSESLPAAEPSIRTYSRNRTHRNNALNLQSSSKLQTSNEKLKNLKNANLQNISIEYDGKSAAIHKKKYYTRSSSKSSVTEVSVQAQLQQPVPECRISSIRTYSRITHRNNVFNLQSSSKLEIPNEKLVNIQNVVLVSSIIEYDANAPIQKKTSKKKELTSTTIEDLSSIPDVTAPEQSRIMFGTENIISAFFSKPLQ